MNKLQNILVILIVLGITGWLRMPHEQKLSKELHALKLVPPRLSLQERAQLKQKAFVATYGSLRPTIAAFMSVTTTGYHSDQKWDKIEDAFSEIVLLDPYNLYYWDQASWHMASNAAADIRDSETLTEVGRKKAFAKYIQKGKDILEQAIKVNPDEWKLLNLKAMLEGNMHRNPDYPAAIKTYKKLLQMPGLQKHIKVQTELKILYAMLQVPELHQETYDYAFELFHKANYYRVDTVTSQIAVGQNHPLNKVSKRMTMAEIYGSDLRALTKLQNKWKRELRKKPSFGVKDAIQKLEEKLMVPQDQRVFPHQPLFIKPNQ